MRRLGCLMVVAVASAWLAGCESAGDFQSLRAGRPMPARNSPEREVLGDPPSGSVGVPLFEVTTSGKKDELPRVRTIADPIRETQQDLAARDASGRRVTTAPAAATEGAPVDPLDRRGTIDLTPRGTPVTRPAGS